MWWFEQPSLNRGFDHFRFRFNGGHRFRRWRRLCDRSRHHGCVCFGRFCRGLRLSVTLHWLCQRPRCWSSRVGPCRCLAGLSRSRKRGCRCLAWRTRSRNRGRRCLAWRSFLRNRVLRSALCSPGPRVCPAPGRPPCCCPIYPIMRIMSAAAVRGSVAGGIRIPVALRPALPPPGLHRCDKHCKLEQRIALEAQIWPNPIMSGPRVLRWP